MKYIEYNGRIVSGVELANTEFKRTLGLMFRLKLLPSTSMLFCSNKPTSVCVHMLFVFFPIEVLFLDSNFKIVKISKLNPFIGFSRADNIQYVLEVKSGTVRKFNISIGNKLQLKEF